MAGRILREDILRAALRILDRGGLPGLAMRRIAGELDVQQSALYWHFRNKQELLGALADDILEPLAPPEAADPARRLLELSNQLHRALLAHTDGAELVATAYAFGLGGAHMRRTFMDALTAAGLALDAASTAASVLLHYVLGYTTFEQQQHQAAELGAIDAPEDQSRENDEFGDGIRLIVAGIGQPGDAVRA